MFPTLSFAGFFLIVFILYWYVFRRTSERKFLLVSASLIFYAFWSVKFLALLVVSVFVNYIFSKRIRIQRDYQKRKNLLILAVCCNIVWLSFFKYLHNLMSFLQLYLSQSHSLFTVSKVLHLNSVVLPLGLSYYTFKCLSYVFDVYLLKIRKPVSFIDFLLYVSFFPQISSGPIVHAAHFFRRLPIALNSDNIRKNSPIPFDRAIVKIISGLYKKMIIANFLSVLFVDPIFANPLQYNTIEILLALIGYAIVIYADFSGYSDMAIGIGLLLGFKTPMNFNRPYLSRSITEFWQRWHISFSSWLKNYVYYALGGSRFGQIRTLAALFFTMIIAGIWHGSRLTFVLWGAFHGFLLVCERIIILIRKHLKKNTITPLRLKKTEGQALSIIKLIYTFTCTTFGWLIFRSTSLKDITVFITALKNTEKPILLLNSPVLVLLVLGLFLQLPPPSIRAEFFIRFMRLPLVIKLVPIIVFFVLLHVIGMSGIPPFIYAGF